MRRVVVISGIAIIGLGIIGFWIAQFWVIGYRYDLYVTTPIHPDPIFTILALLAILIGFVIFVYGVLAESKPKMAHYADCADGLAILEKRYALSEISRDEYFQKKEDLKRV